MSAGVDKDEQKLHHAIASAGDAFDKIDSDGNGYIMIDELQRLTESLGLPLRLEEQDGAINALNGDGDSVLDREEWIRWWVQRSSTFQNLSDIKKEKIRSSCDDDNEILEELIAKARQGRRRAGTDIFTAAWQGDLALVKSFLGHDLALANAADDSEFGLGYRPLHYASYGGFLEICRALHAAGARAWIAGENGVTPLFLAAQAGQSNVVRYLLALGADPLACELECGLCPVDVAQLYPEIFEQMQLKGEFETPKAPLAPPSVIRVRETAMQVAFCMIRQESGKLPLTRYEIRVEEDLENEGAAGLSSSQSNVASMPSTTQSKTIWGDALGGRQGSIGLEKNSVTSIGKPKAGLTHSKPSSSSACYGGNEGQMPLTDQPSSGENGGSCAKEDSDGGDDSGVRIVELMLVPASRGNVIAKPSMTSAEEEERKLVTVRGLKPSTRYRVKVAAINAVGFGPYGPPSKWACTSTAEEIEPGRTMQKERSGKTEETLLSAQERGRRRQALAMERRRRMDQEVRELQHHQQLEAEELHARRARRLAAQRTRSGVKEPTASRADSRVGIRRGDRRLVAAADAIASAKPSREIPQLPGSGQDAADIHTSPRLDNCLMKDNNGNNNNNNNNNNRDQSGDQSSDDVAKVTEQSNIPVVSIATGEKAASTSRPTVITTTATTAATDPTRFPVLVASPPLTARPKTSDTGGTRPVRARPTRPGTTGAPTDVEGVRGRWGEGEGTARHDIYSNPAEKASRILPSQRSPRAVVIPTCPGTGEQCNAKQERNQQPGQHEQLAEHAAEPPPDSNKSNENNCGSGRIQTDRHAVHGNDTAATNDKNEARNSGNPRNRRGKRARARRKRYDRRGGGGCKLKTNDE